MPLHRWANRALTCEMWPDQNHLQLLLPHNRHIIQRSHRCKEAGSMVIVHTDVGGGPTGEATILEKLGTNLHLVSATPSQMRVLQQAGTHHVPFLQHPDWPSRLILENLQQMAATTARRPPPADGEVCDAYNLFWSTHKQPLPEGPRARTRPNTDRQNRSGTFRRPPYRQSSYWRPTSSKSPCVPAKHSGNG